MCWILIKKSDNELPIDYIKQAQKKNKHGYGVSWYDGTATQTYKTLNFTEYLDFLHTVEDKELIIHLRNTTAGSNDLANSHPFKVHDNLLFHNGTFFTLKDHTSDQSDTSILAQILNNCEYTNILPLLQVVAGDTLNRLVFLNKDGSIDIINKHLGIEEDGNWYSNDYHIPERLHKVFVYGTLKMGLSNQRLLLTSDYLGDATTVDKWAMIGADMAFPYVLEKEIQGHNITGEVYEVTDTTLANLDRLEGSPTHYHKVTVKVTMHDEVIECGMYKKTMVTSLDRAKPYIKTFHDYWH